MADKEHLSVGNDIRALALINIDVHLKEKKGEQDGGNRKSERG